MKTIFQDFANIFLSRSREISCPIDSLLMPYLSPHDVLLLCKMDRITLHMTRRAKVFKYARYDMP